MKKIIILSFCFLATQPLTLQAKETDTATNLQTLEPLKTIQAIEEEVTEYQMLDAQIEAVNKSTVSSQTGGVISKLNYDVGDFVKKGSLIARITSQTQKSELQQAKASVSQAKASVSSANAAITGALASMKEAEAAISRASASVTQAQASTREARAQYEVARADFNRAKGLYDKRILTKSQFDQANAAMRSTLARVESSKAKESAAEAERVAAVSRLSSSKANLTSAKANLASAKAGLSSSQASLSKAGEQLGYTEVIAPYSGIVVERHVELGELVSPSVPIMTGISLDEMRAVSDIPQRLILAIREYNTARVYPDGDDTGISVKKLTIFPYADAKTNSFKIRASLDSAVTGLFPGVFVKIGFEVGKEKQLVVPASAIAYRSEVTGIYVIDENKRPVLRQVRLGKTTPDGKIRVLAGLSSGETIALDPTHAAVYLKTERLKQSQQSTDNADSH